MPSDVTSDVIAPALLGRCRLIKLKAHTKIAAESGWNLDANYSPEDEEIIGHISSGLNYGLIPTNDLVVIDCDTKKLYESLPEHWHESLTVITGRDGEIGHHVFLDCPDSPKEKFVINDPVTKSPLGDIRGSGSPFYTVGAGSIHPETGRKYHYVDPDATLVTVPWSEIAHKIIDKFGASSPVIIKKEIPSHVKSENSITETLGLRIEDFTMPDNPISRPNGDIQGSHPIHGSTTGMNFSINPRKNVFFCFRDQVGGDPIAWIAYAHCGVSETDCNSLSDEQFKEVRTWLSNNGFSEKIKQLDVDFHGGPGYPKNVDTSAAIKKLMKNKNTNESPSKEKEPSSDKVYIPIISDEELAQEKIIACQQNTLPPFPEIYPGLFHDYIEFGKRVSYSLHEYHFAALMTIVSMALGRKIKIQMGMVQAYPNVFALVVGHTTISGKSVACNMAIDSLGPAIVHEEPIVKYFSTVIMRGTVSEAAICQEFSEIYHRLWYYDDCAGFFKDASGWNSKILQTMCTLYDGYIQPKVLSKKGKKGDEQYRWECPAPFCSVLFNITNSDIENISNNDMFSSGFFPRFMWFYGEGGIPRKNADVSDTDIAIKDSIFQEIVDLRTSLGSLQNDSIVFGVCDEIEDWKINATLGRLGKEDEAYRTAIARGFVHAYKIAAILTMVDHDFQNTVLDRGVENYPLPKVKIPIKHAKMAIKIVEEYLIPRMVYIAGLCHVGDIRNHQVIVRKNLVSLGGLAERSKLLQRTHLNSKDLSIALATMIESGEVKVVRHKKEGSQKLSEYIILQETE